MSINLRSVSKKFGSREVISSVNLTVENTRLASIMGKSGSGKTTLLSLIAGLTNPDSGGIFIDNTEISKFTEEERAAFRLRHIGIVFQDFKLIASLSAYENIYLAVHPRRDLSSQEKERRVSELIEAVGLLELKNQLVDKLSGGEKQRVAIARSLANHPDVVLADEPTGNLDSATAQTIMNLFKDMHRRFQTLFLIVTHDRDIAGQTEKIFHLKDGRTEV